MSAELRHLAETALEIALEEAAVRDRMRAAFLRDDQAEALHCARILAGLEEDDAQGDRAAPS